MWSCWTGVYVPSSLVLMWCSPHITVCISVHVYMCVHQRRRKMIWLRRSPSASVPGSTYHPSNNPWPLHPQLATSAKVTNYCPHEGWSLVMWVGHHQFVNTTHMGRKTESLPLYQHVAPITRAYMGMCMCMHTMQQLLPRVHICVHVQ